MNQNDFRALLSAKTSARDGSSGGGAKSGGFGGKRNMTESDLDEIRRLSKKPKKKSGKKPGKNKAGDSNDDAGNSSSAKKSAQSASVYRDRAAERRQGIRSDMIDADEFAHFDAEQTKFLGGDVEHTHLVKGLDFALLSQLKREKEKLLQATAAHRQTQTQQSQSQSQQAGSTSEKLAFKTRVGRLVYFHAVQSNAMATASSSLASRASEHFLPGRMYYTFALSASELESVPVIVQRSKDDCPEPDDVVSGMVSELVISKIGDALRGGGSSKRLSGKKLRRKKKLENGGGNHDGSDGDEAHEHGDGDDDAHADDTKTAAPVIESDDEDIFPEVGEYVPIHERGDDGEHELMPQASASEPRAASSSGAAGYFSNLSASISAAEQAEKQREVEAEQAWKQTIRKVVATQSQAEREQKAREEQRGTQVDEYSECYPEYQAAASAFDSEDDEETPRKGAGKDGGDDDDAASAEAAATEKTRRRKQKQGNKLQSDLEKINKLLDAKKTASS